MPTNDWGMNGGLRIPPFVSRYSNSWLQAEPTMDTKTVSENVLRNKILTKYRSSSQKIHINNSLINNNVILKNFTINFTPYQSDRNQHWQKWDKLTFVNLLPDDTLRRT